MKGVKWRTRGGLGVMLTNNVSVSLEINRSTLTWLRITVTAPLPPPSPLLAQLISLFNWFLCDQR